MFYIYYPGNLYNNSKEVLLQMRKQSVGEEITQGLQLIANSELKPRSLPFQSLYSLSTACC